MSELAEIVDRVRGAYGAWAAHSRQCPGECAAQARIFATTEIPWQRQCEEAYALTCQEGLSLASAYVTAVDELIQTYRRERPRMVVL